MPLLGNQNTPPGDNEKQGPSGEELFDALGKLYEAEPDNFIEKMGVTRPDVGQNLLVARTGQQKALLKGKESTEDLTKREFQEYLKGQVTLGQTSKFVESSQNKEQAYREVVSEIKKVDPTAPDEYNKFYTAAAITGVKPIENKIRDFPDLAKQMFDANAVVETEDGDRVGVIKSTEDNPRSLEMYQKRIPGGKVKLTTVDQDGNKTTTVLDEKPSRVEANIAKMSNMANFHGAIAAQKRLRMAKVGDQLNPKAKAELQKEIDAAEKQALQSKNALNVFLGREQELEAAKEIEAIKFEGNKALSEQKAKIDAAIDKAKSAKGGEDTLRKEFISGSKDYVKVLDAWRRIRASGQESSAAGDLALIFNYMKVLDPGSTVREGEFANAQNSGSIPSRITAQYNKIRAGERLSDTQRKDFLDRSSKLFNAQHEGFKKLTSEFDRIVANRDLNRENVIVDPTTEDDLKPIGGAKKVDTLAEKRAKLRRLREQKGK